jgi:hypothetical protein
MKQGADQLFMVINSDAEPQYFDAAPALVPERKVMRLWLHLLTNIIFKLRARKICNTLYKIIKFNMKSVGSHGHAELVSDAPNGEEGGSC